MNSTCDDAHAYGSNASLSLTCVSGQKGHDLSHTPGQALLAGPSTANPVSPSTLRGFRNVWDDCAVPGTMVDVVDGTQNCTCNDMSPTCTAEVWVDPYRMYPVGDPARPAWVDNKPWRMPCPSYDLLPTALFPMYFMKAPRFYEPEYLDCTGGTRPSRI